MSKGENKPVIVEYTDHPPAMLPVYLPPKVSPTLLFLREKAEMDSVFSISD